MVEHSPDASRKRFMAGYTGEPTLRRTPERQQTAEPPRRSVWGRVVLVQGGGSESVFASARTLAHNMAKPASWWRPALACESFSCVCENCEASRAHEMKFITVRTFVRAFFRAAIGLKNAIGFSLLLDGPLLLARCRRVCV